MTKEWLRLPYLPPAQPEEFSWGWFGRALALNGDAGRRAEPYLLAARFSTKRHHHDVLGAHVPERTSQVVKDCSLAAFHAYALHGETPPPLSDWHTSIKLLLGRPEPQKPSAYCNQCMADDKARLGFSYWRRHHQLPGVFRCREHKTPLEYADAHTAFAFLPGSRYVAENPAQRPYDYRLGLDTEHSPNAALYERIALHALEAPVPTSLKPMWDRIQTLADKHRVLAQRVGEYTYVARAIALAFPAAWLSAVFIGGLERSLAPRIFARGPMRMLINAPSTRALICAVIALSDSADEALETIFGTSCGAGSA